MWMQELAAELNLPMTAFVVARADGDHDLRWFTPTTEVQICGHATLAAAHLLGGETRFHTRSGLLTGRRSSDGRLELDFPAIPVNPVPAPEALLEALGLAADATVGTWTGGEWWLVELPAGRLVRELVPDRARLLALGDVAVVVFATPGDRDGVDSVCRVFEPASGIDEDPVTGSAHCALAPLLAARTGGVNFTGEQASARGGFVGMHVLGDRVLLRGLAVTVFEGALSSSPP
jgi:PhzF family phenazine biosynthesis protein